MCHKRHSKIHCLQIRKELEESVSAILIYCLPHFHNELVFLLPSLKLTKSGKTFLVIIDSTGYQPFIDGCKTWHQIGLRHFNSRALLLPPNKMLTESPQSPIDLIDHGWGVSPRISFLLAKRQGKSPSKSNTL